MKRIVLILALTALMVAVSVTGSALAQTPPDESCPGLESAVTAQDDAAIPPNERAEKGERGIGEGAENSVVREELVGKENCG